MRRLIGSLFLSAAVLSGGCLAAGCSSSGGGPLASLSPTRKVTSLLPSRTASSLPSPTASGSAAVPPPATATATPSAAVPTAASRAAAPTAAPSSAASASGSGSATIWPWILLAAIVVVGAVVLTVRASGRRSRNAASWQSQVVDAYATGSALHDAISVAELPAALAGEDAGARLAGHSAPRR